MATAHVNVKGRTSMDGRGWSAGLRKMETGTKGAAGRMASGMAGALGGVFAVGFLVSATRRIVAHADQVHKTAVRIGASTDTIQKFDFAATQSGATMGDVEKSFINTAKAMESAKQGLTTHIRAFQAFGISMQMLNVMSPEQVFLKVADAIEKAGGAMDKAKSLQDIMGRGGKALIPAFVSGFTGLAGNAPKGIDNETIESLVKFNDEMDRLRRTILPSAAAGVATLANAWESFFSNISFDNFEENLLHRSQAGPAADPKFDISQREWDVIGAEFGKALMGPSALKDPAVMRAAKLPQVPNVAEAIRTVKADEAEAAAARAANTSWSKPSLQLNSLQRIGAAVSQSADPVAIEKDNNKLLKTIAKNTKQTANNTDNEF
mgnify:FL=1